MESQNRKSILDQRKEKQRYLSSRITKIVLSLIVVTGCLMLSACGSNALGQNAETFGEAFSQDAILQNGVASNDFLNDSKYEIVDFEATEITKTNDLNVSANFSATIENENYITKLSGTVQFNKMKDTDNSGIYLFELETDSTTPKKAIDFDSFNNPVGDNAVLSKDKNSCTVDTLKINEFWFADSTIKTVDTYTFNGERWIFEGTDSSHTINYQNFDGNYTAKTGGLTDLSSFEISSLDADKGTFSIKYGVKSVSLPVGLTGMKTYPEASGTFEIVTIDPQSGGAYVLDDSYSYYFEATGTSSMGKGNTANIKGYFTKGETNGESCIEVTEFNISAEYTLWSGDLQYENAAMGTGTLYKQ